METRDAKAEIRDEVANKLAELSAEEIAKTTKLIENRLFDFANFLESKIILLYVNRPNEVPSENILKRCFEYRKIVVLPVFKANKFKATLWKIDNLKTDLIADPSGVMKPDPARCKLVPIDRIDIAIIPATALDEKGGRIGDGNGFYDRLIPNLPITTRKVALASETQIVPQVPMESHDKYMDIIITDKRVIYKI
ncbi:MAG: 5-formyltetrahydrofolate cyclo-ligase [Desulfobacterales bacterium]|nr:5-formyltetrahydrofolate cyclo-ligase [Desulfobacterales bacterium]